MSNIYDAVTKAISAHWKGQMKRDDAYGSCRLKRGWIFMSLLSGTLTIAACATPPVDSPSLFTIVSVDERSNRIINVPVKLHLPEAQTSSKPAVIFIGGCDGSITENGAALIAYLNSKGVLVAELRSIDSFERGSACVQTTVSGRQRADEAFRTRDALVARRLASEDNVGLLGFSSGGWTISHAAFNDTTPAYNASTKMPFAAAVAFYPYCRTRDARSYDLKVPTLLLGGSADTWTPFALCKTMAQISKDRTIGNAPLELVEYAGATHSWENNKPPRQVTTGAGSTYLAYDAAAAKDSLRRAIAWFDQYLRP